MRVIVGAGSGLTARAAASAGAEAIACYSTAMYRIKGLPTALSFLPYDDCNALTLGILPEIRSAVPESIPLIVGVGAHDPRINLARHVSRVAELGGTGVMNEPFLGIYGESIRTALDVAGLGFQRELDLLKTAVGLGLTTLAWVFTADQAVRLAGMGATYIGAMAGIMAEGPTGDEEMAYVSAELGAIAQAARAENDAVTVLGHGGPLNTAENCRRIVVDAGLDGVVTGSNGERKPAHDGIVNELAALLEREDGC